MDYIAIHKTHPEVIRIENDIAYDINGNEVTINQAKVDEYISQNAHIRPRAMAYPSIQEQLDMQYHDAVNGTTTWKDAIAKVKSDIPKGGS
tara:strand:+ start:657 stop:929 length:273 start_codon:yes stop_codon:yes gene_type:complete